MFRVTRSVLSLVLLAGGLVAVAGTAPAAATGTVSRNRAESQRGTAVTKSATASCPDDQTLIGTGGWVAGNDGSVVLTGIVPTITSVTASAAAVPDQDTAAWSVVAIAVCRTTGTAAARPLVPVTITTGSSTADCAGGTLLSGVGFALAGTAGQELLTGLVPDATRVTATAVVRAPRVAPPTAYAVCVAPEANTTWVRVDGSTGCDTTAPKTATAAGSPYGHPADVYSVGGQVTDGTTDVYLDALVPDPGLRSGTARASELAGGTDPDPWSLTAYAPDALYYY